MGWALQRLMRMGVPGVLGWARDGLNWLLLDRFSTDLTAGNVNGTLSDSGHTRTLTDSVPNAVVTGGEFKVTAIAAVRDPWLRYADGVARAAGRMHRFNASANGLAADNWLVGLATTLTTPGVAQTLGVVFGASTIKATPANTQIAAYVAGTETEIDVIERSTGFFVVVAGKLMHIYRTGTTATLYPHAAGLAADAAVDCRADDQGVIDLDPTNPTLFPTPTLSDTFSDTSAPYVSDGLAHVEGGAGDGVAWEDTAGQWSNSGNKAYIVPQPRDELLTNPDFSAWTADDPDGWAITGEVGTDPEVSEVGTGEGHGGVGSGMCNIYSSATASRPFLAQTAIVVGEFYRGSFVVDTRNSGTIKLCDNATSGLFAPPAAAADAYTGTKRNSTGTTVILYLGAVPPIDMTIDNVSMKLLPFADCLRVASPADAAEPYASVKMTITANTQAGLVINLDSYSNPQNCIHVWYDRTNSKVYAREMTAGSWGADKLAGVAATYSAGAYLEVRRIGTSVYVFYNGAYVGSWTTALTSANTKVALFATDAASYLENVTSFPTNGLDHSAYA